jgi:hypothetical protein
LNKYAHENSILAIKIKDDHVLIPKHHTLGHVLAMNKPKTAFNKQWNNRANIWNKDPTFKTNLPLCVYSNICMYHTYVFRATHDEHMYVPYLGKLTK